MTERFTSSHEGPLHQAILAGQAPQVVTHLLEIAVFERASDIHIEPLEDMVRVRIRVDGRLHQLVEYSANLHNSVVARIKIMANLKIDVHRKPQDGRIHASLEKGKEVDLRVSTFPTIFGEKIVMRIIDKSKKIPSLEAIGLEGRNLDVLQRILKNPNGIILNTGPTGSGKSTTLYSCLQVLNKEDVNIITLEDPVENQVRGLNQSQVQPDIGYDFAFGLRNSLRQDPDIMMVGEIRDKETMETAFESALTGHLVLSTLHTNSASETITRLLNMDAPRYLLASTIQIIIAQRLTRQLCSHCMKWVEPTDAVRKEILDELKHVNKAELQKRIPTFNYQTFKIPEAGDGCEHCNNLGYKGRLAIFEIVEFTEKFQEALVAGESIAHLVKLTSEEGTVFLKQDGLIRVIQGKTTLDEVLAKV